MFFGIAVVGPLVALLLPLLLFLAYELKGCSSHVHQRQVQCKSQWCLRPTQLMLSNNQTAQAFTCQISAKVLVMPKWRVTPSAEINPLLLLQFAYAFNLTIYIQ